MDVVEIGDEDAEQKGKTEIDKRNDNRLRVRAEQPKLVALCQKGGIAKCLNEKEHGDDADVKYLIVPVAGLRLAAEAILFLKLLQVLFFSAQILLLSTQLHYGLIDVLIELRALLGRFNINGT